MHSENRLSESYINILLKINYTSHRYFWPYKHNYIKKIHAREILISRNYVMQNYWLDFSEKNQIQLTNFANKVPM